MSIDASTGDFKPIRLMRNADAYHRMLRHRFSVPRKLVNPVIRGIKHLMNPSDGTTRARVAARLGAPGEWDLKLRNEGYVSFAKDAFPDLQAALAKHGEALMSLTRQAAQQGMNASANKTMLTTVVRNAGWYDYPEILQFAISRPIVDLATRYFGRVPLLTALNLWWSPPNDTLQQSQLFHCDGEDARQLKFFFNITDVTEDHGPFVLLPLKPSEELKAAKGIVAGKVEDSVIEAAGMMDQCVTFTGVTGEGACVDTCRCLHYGSRGNSKPRVVLMIRFNDHLAPNVDMPDWHLRAGELKGGVDEIQKLVLGIET